MQENDCKLQKSSNLFYTKAQLKPWNTLELVFSAKETDNLLNRDEVICLQKTQDDKNETELGLLRQLHDTC